uniref:Uncharacterized protein n=1 Tax=Anguilla anguilla TaxID=7936 RepID=A0A0E9V2E5_ANGAN
MLSMLWRGGNLQCHGLIPLLYVCHCIGDCLKSAYQRTGLHTTLVTAV